MMKQRWLCAFIALIAGCGIGVMPAAAQSSHENRVTVWAPSMSVGGPRFHEQTLRMVVHASTGGSALRIQLSNLRGDRPLRVGGVSIAAQSHGAGAVAHSLRNVTVSQATSFSIPAGQEVFSDPIPMSINAGQNVLVSLYLPQGTSPATWHSDAFETTYASASGSGNQVMELDGSSYVETSTSWYYLAGLDVLSKVRGTVVAFGDSITDGTSTPTSTYQRWPDYLARRLADDHYPLGVVDAGIGGNRVLSDSPNKAQGISAIKRFAHDALHPPGVHSVILMEGINDIGNDAGLNGAPLTAQALIDGYRHIIKQAHHAGVRIIGATMLPDKGSGYYSEAHEAIRQSCNQWIRSSAAFDGVVDFDQAVQDPADPAALRASYDSSDHLHPNAAGMQAMANAIDLQLLKK
ncbi:SGNH/GDSL hydrolase family protein [Dyella silvatica]|uniref:SGNH/GDSL hydrolase family protein n=1 Tax=Dyella silvatica TaxID=2992128 RepID=UPI002252A125|nr:SGNH/GDSL hydrolase family protein [Dyella silvatica]